MSFVVVVGGGGRSGICRGGGWGVRFRGGGRRGQGVVRLGSVVGVLDYRSKGSSPSLL